MILSYTVILPVSQIQTQQVMTSQVRTHLIQTNNIFVLLLYSKLTRNIAALGILIRSNDDFL